MKIERERSRNDRGEHKQDVKLFANLAEVDKKTTEEWGIPGLKLMEAAGQAVAKCVVEQCHRFPQSERPIILIFCGSGNNGGDGFVCARWLAQHDNLDARVHVVTGFEQPLGLSDDAQANWEALSQFNVQKWLKPSVDSLNQIFSNQPLIIVDALFGSGLSRPIGGLPQAWIDWINQQQLQQAQTRVVAVDLPSGIRGEDGCVMGVAVKADFTVTFATGKPGLYLSPGKQYAGKVSVVDIGIPQDLISSEPSPYRLITAEYVRSFLPTRATVGHKYHFGHVVVVGGCHRMPGAAVLSAWSALNAGCGVVTLAMPQTAFDRVHIPLELIHCALPQSDSGTLSEDSFSVLVPVLEKAQVIVFGPGVSVCEQTQAFWQRLHSWFVMQNNPPRLLMDADGLNLLAQLPLLLPLHSVITPHIGECSRLLNQSSSDIQDYRLEAIQQLVHQQPVTVVLKSDTTLVQAPEAPIWINPTGNSALATAGSGDVLSGLIAGLMAQGSTSLEAACMGVYLHGLAADIGVNTLTPYCFKATDVLSYLPQAIKNVLQPVCIETTQGER